MAASHCMSYHPHPAAALRHDQFQNTREDITSSEYYHYYAGQESPSEYHNKTEQRTYPPAYPADLLLPPPPYYRGRESIDLSTLPPLPETPIEEENFPYSDEVFGTYAVAGDRRPLRHELDSDSDTFLRKQLTSDSSNSSYSHYQQNKINSSQTKAQKSATVRDNHRSHDIPQITFSDSPMTMGSGGSIMSGCRPTPEQYPEERNSTKHKPREIIQLSDKRDKPSSGMKKKLRQSLDKLNFRAFPWGSTDKLTSSSSTSVTPRTKKSSNKGGIRRYSDSNAPASINSITSVLSKTRNNRESPLARPGSSSSYNDVIAVHKAEGNSVVSKGWSGQKLIKAYIGGSKDALRDGPIKTRKSDYGPWSTVASTFSTPMNPHSVKQSMQDRQIQSGCDNGRKSLPIESNVMLRVNASENQYVDQPHSGLDQKYENKTYQPVSTRQETHVDRTVCEYPVMEGSGENAQFESYSEYDMKYYSDRGINQTGNHPVPLDVCKAKGTWSLLRNVQNSPRRVAYTSSNPTSSYNSPYGSTETLLSSGSQSRSKSKNKILDPNREGVFAKPTPPGNMHPPPKLTPVSGKLIVNKNSNASSIIRPTAFKAVVPAMKRVSPPNDHQTLHMNRDGQIKNSHPEISISTDSYHCNSSPNTDSASEGYESARVSSSTAHDQHSDKGSESGAPTSTTATTSPKDYTRHSRENSVRSTADDVMIRDLESKVRERENDILQLQKSLEENEKTLSRVYDEREEGGKVELGTKYCSQMKSQNQKFSKSPQIYQRRCILLQEENKNLIESNKKLEERLSAASGVSHSEVTSTTSVGEVDDEQLHADADSAQSRLEDCQWTLQQKCGEISMLKRLLRESQADVNRRSAEVGAQRSLNRELRDQFETRDQEAGDLLNKLKARDSDIIELEKKLRRNSNYTPHSRSSSSSSATYGRNSVSFSSPPPSPTPHEGHVSLKGGKSKAKFSRVVEQNNNNGHTDLVQSHLLLQAEVETLRRKLTSAEEHGKFQQEKFEREKAKWNDEKAKVIRYQKKLQAGYVEVHKRSQELEDQVQRLTEEIENLRKTSNEDITSNHELRFPTDI